MARFRWLGEISRSGLVQKYGPTYEIRLPLKEGGKQVIKAADPRVGFVVGKDIGADVVDERALRIARVDPRFEEIV